MRGIIILLEYKSSNTRWDYNEEKDKERESLINPVSCLSFSGSQQRSSLMQTWERRRKSSCLVLIWLWSQLWSPTLICCSSACWSELRSPPLAGVAWLFYGLQLLEFCWIWLEFHSHLFTILNLTKSIHIYLLFVIWTLQLWIGFVGDLICWFGFWFEFETDLISGFACLWIEDLDFSFVGCSI